MTWKSGTGTSVTGTAVVPLAEAMPKNVMTGPSASEMPSRIRVTLRRSEAVIRPSLFASAPEQLTTPPPSTPAAASPSPSNSSTSRCRRSAAVVSPSQSASPRSDAGGVANAGAISRATSARTSLTTRAVALPHTFLLTLTVLRVYADALQHGQLP